MCYENGKESVALIHSYVTIVYKCYTKGENWPRNDQNIAETQEHYAHTNFFQDLSWREIAFGNSWCAVWCAELYIMPSDTVRGNSVSSRGWNIDFLIFQRTSDCIILGGTSVEPQKGQL